jgi:hypothetical protein
MSEPLSNLPPLPEPFAVAPRTLRAQGCGRGALIGCGVLIAIFGVAMVGLAMNKDRLLHWIFERMQTQIEAHLPADLAPAERGGLSAAFADLYRAMGEGKVNPESAQALQRELFAVASDIDRGLSREQVLRLTSAIERAAGKAPEPGGVGPPVPEPSTAPTATPLGSAV